MKIHFTKKEYQRLVEMLLVADWVITAHEEEERDETKPYRELRKKVLAHYKEMGMAEAFRYSPEDDEYFETAAYEMSAPHMGFIREYDEQVLWEELATKLAERDFVAEEMLRAAGARSDEERAERLLELTALYEQELAENGLDNVQVVLDTQQVH